MLSLWLDGRDGVRYHPVWAEKHYIIGLLWLLVAFSTQAYVPESTFSGSCLANMWKAPTVFIKMACHYLADMW